MDARLVSLVPPLEGRNSTDTRASTPLPPSGAQPAEAPGRRRQGLGPRERIELLVDPYSFTEINSQVRHRATGFGIEQRRPPTDGVVTGWGTIDGRHVFVFAHDSSVFGGSLGEMFASKVHALMDRALATGAPIIGLNDGGGARIQEGIVGLAGFGGIFSRSTRSSGVIPQLSVILGPCAGGAAYGPALSDFTFMVRDTSRMFVTGPDVVAAVTGESVSIDELGGADVHATLTGSASYVAEDEASCLEAVRFLVGLLPANNQQSPPRDESQDPPDRRCDALHSIVPISRRVVYDVRDVVEEIVDDREYLEIQEHYGANLVCAVARLDGHPVGIVANQPLVMAGALDSMAAEKAARFVRTCDAFNIPLVTLVDVPGFLPGTDQEHGGIVRRGAKLLYAYCEATVPRVQLIMRKAYGGAYIVMDSKSIGCDISFAWPTNEIAVMGAEAACNIVFRREIEASDDPEQTRARLIAEYTERLMNPHVGPEAGLIDEVIDPADTRAVLVDALAMLRSKCTSLPHRKHGNIPL
jgi:methylmalonyl-CoA decarboxylase subunit alpha